MHQEGQLSSSWQFIGIPHQSVFKHQAKAALGINRRAIIYYYRDLRQRQKTFLSNINLPQQLKQQLYGISQQIMDRNSNKLVSVLHPFRGRLIMNEQEWAKLQNKVKTQIKNQNNEEQEQYSSCYKNSQQAMLKEHSKKQIINLQLFSNSACQKVQNRFNTFQKDQIIEDEDEKHAKDTERKMIQR